MSSLIVPEGYKSILLLRDRQRAIKIIKDTFERELSNALSLERVSAPIMVLRSSGLNDNLNGVERPVDFDIPEVSGDQAEIVHSLAKWKRQALKQYDFEVGRGLYTDMNAIRRDEEMDNLHSTYVDQWDWEAVISEESRTRDTLHSAVERIAQCVTRTLACLRSIYPEIRTELPDKVTFITSEELLQKYPSLTAKERENAVCKEYGLVFIEQIGGKLSNGEIHDGRAPDYDDWGLNGDILYYFEPLDRAFEVSSMGIRVDRLALLRQLLERNAEDRLALPYHKALEKGELPFTIGGGIGQSRLCMLMLGSAHIGEVQASIWDFDTLEKCKIAGIKLL